LCSASYEVLYNLKSTSLQLLEVLDKWTEAIDKGSDVDVIYMDFQKAFDKVPHKRLIRKAKNYMLDNPLLEWIEDFITGSIQWSGIQCNLMIDQVRKLSRCQH
jgi:hypothetical protein